MMTRIFAAIAALSIGGIGTALAAADYQTTVPLESPAHTIETARGPAYITSGFGSLQTTTLPGSAEQGVLTSNGNGTSTLIAPGTIPEIVATPK